MTREEAIKYGIEWLKDEHLDAKDEAFIKIALEALEQEPITTTAGEGGVMYYPQVEGVTPTVVSTGKQVPCDDAISREDALMCLTGEIKETDTIETIIARSVRRIRKLPPVSPQLCEDAISRQSAIFLANDLKQDLPDDERIADMVMAHNEGVSEYQTQLSILPPVNPQPKTGHWIRWYEQIDYDWDVDYIPHCKCSECGKEYDPHSSQFIKYCNECGAKMSEIPTGSVPQERSDKNE